MLSNKVKDLLLSCLGSPEARNELSTAIDNSIITTSNINDGLIGSTIQNSIYVDGINGNDSNTGSALYPLKTISQAMNKIGQPTSTADFNVDSTSRWIIHLIPGVYTEDITIPMRQYIMLDLNGSSIVGNITYSLNADFQVGNILFPKLVIKDSDLRSAYTGAGYPLTGITGNITATGTGSAHCVIEVIQAGINGNLQTNGVISLVFLNDVIITGSINTLAVGDQLTLYAANCDTSGAKAINGINGGVVLNILRNIRFDGTVAITGNTVQNGARWFNVQFKSGTSHDFTGTTGVISVDANSYASFNTNVPSKGSVTFTLLDDAIGMNYTPITSSNWNGTAPTTIQNALDRCAALLKTLNGGTGP